MQPLQAAKYWCVVWQTGVDLNKLLTTFDQSSKFGRESSLKLYEKKYVEKRSFIIAIHE